MKVVPYFGSNGRSPVAEYIKSLPHTDRTAFYDAIKAFEKYGLEQQEYKCRQIRGKLWEIKIAARDGSYRTLYVLLNQETMIWLHAFKKESQKAPLRELRKAEGRAQSVGVRL